jgi:galactosamine-6-phosphate isomerase
MSRRVAADILRELRRNPGLLLGVSSGQTPTSTYERLAQARKAAPALFRRLRIVVLDEWLGLPGRHPATCEAYVREKVLRPLGIDRSRSRSWRAAAKDPSGECRRMSSWLERRGPIDLCILGLGRNGHILMNEPAPALDPLPHVARLTAETRRHSMLESVKVPPRFGLTLGLGDILRARRILFLVSGRHKVAPLKRMLSRRVSPRCPASFLWLHPDVTLYCDREAGRALRGAKSS